MIEKEKILKSRLMFTIFSILILFGVVLSYWQYYHITQDINSNNDTTDRYLKERFDFYTEKIKKSLYIKSDILLKIPGVLEAFYNRDREKLFTISDNFYKRVKKNYPDIQILTFRLKDGSAFLRVHKPEMFGDALNKNREIIVDTNELKKRHSGFEVGKLKMVYRVVTPIFYRGEHIGLVEIGIEPEHISKNIMLSFDNIKTALIIKKTTLSNSLDKTTRDTIDGNFALIRGEKLFFDIFKKIKREIKDPIIKYKGSVYLIHTHNNLLSHKKEIVAKVIIAQNIDKEYKHFIYSLKINITLIIILTLILFLFINITLNKFLKSLEESRVDLIQEKDKIDKLNTELNSRVKQEIQKSLKKDSLLQQKSRLAQMGEMMENIAHQWRQPLNELSLVIQSFKWFSCFFCKTLPYLNQIWKITFISI